MMSKKSESNLLTVNRNRLVPKLRFPEFLKNSEWEKKNFKNFGYFIRGLTYNSKDVSDNGLLVLRAGNIKNENLVLDNDLVFVNKECPEELYLKPGDIVICMSSGSKNLVGKNAEYVGNYPNSLTVGAFCSIFRSDNRLMKSIFQTKSYENHISLSIGEGNIKNLSNSDLELFEFWTPVALSEQQKIADCLSSIDDLITAETQKLEALKQHKKGLLQNLFPREGEKVPRLRFPEFKDSGEWEEKKLGEIAEIISERAGSKNYVAMSVTSGIGLIPQKEKFGKNISGNQFKNYYVIKRGDFAYNKSSTKAFPQGYIAMLKNFEEAAVPNSIFTCFRVNRELVFPQFLDYLFQENYHGKYLKKYIEIGARAHGALSIEPEILMNMPLTLPNNQRQPLSEQEKIVSFLSSLDELINAQNEKVETLRNHKKGLLQGLFPEVN